MNQKITTETGSVYIIDFENKKWERVNITKDSGPLRTDGGSILNGHPLEIKVGSSLCIITDKVTEEDRIRRLLTSPVVSVEDYNEESN